MQLAKRIIIAVLLLFFISSLTKNLFDYRKNISFYQNFKNDYDKEKKRNVELKTRILKNGDPDTIEKTIRDKLNLLRPNEIAVILPNPSPSPTPFVPTPEPPIRQWYGVFLSPHPLN